MTGPPRPFISRLVQGVVVSVAEGHGVLIRHLEAHGPGLRKLQVVRLSGATAADETGLARHEAQMIAIADAGLLGDQKSGASVGRRRKLCPTDLPQSLFERADQGGT